MIARQLHISDSETNLNSELHLKCHYLHCLNNLNFQSLLYNLCLTPKADDKSKPERIP